MTSSASQHLNCLPRNENMVVLPMASVVLLPGTLQPIHVGLNRDCDSVREAMATDGLICVVLIDPVDPRVADVPAVHPLCRMGCIARIEQAAECPDGGLHLVVRGLCRARVQSADLPERGGARAQVTAIEDVDIDDDPTARGQLLVVFRRAMREPNTPLLDELPMGRLCDTLAVALRTSSVQSQRILEAVDVRARRELLTEYLESIARSDVYVAARTPTSYPPGFSVN